MRSVGVVVWCGRVLIVIGACFYVDGVDMCVNVVVFGVGVVGVGCYIVSRVMNVGVYVVDSV